VCCWNIEGLLPKLEFSDFIDYLKTFTIFCLLETWYEHDLNSLNSFPDYVMYAKKSLRLQNVGRSMSGFCVCVHNSLKNYVSHIDTPHKFCMFFKVKKSIVATTKDLLLIFSYLPPDNSPSYEKERFSGIKYLEYALSELPLNLNEYYFVLLGDLNARTSDQADFIVDFSRENLPILREYDSVLTSSFDKRNSMDKVCNSQGQFLLHFCISNHLLIANGRLGEDKKYGHFTFVNANGKSVIDYAILSEYLFNEVINFRIGERTESCHFPLEIKFKSKVEKTTDMPNPRKNRKTYCFEQNNLSLFMGSLQDTFTIEFMSRTLSFINDNSNNINSIVSHIVGIFQQCSSVCLKESKGKVSTLRPQWFDKKCRDYKRAKLSCLHNFRVNSSETNLNKYVQSKKEFKECCNHKKRLFY